MIDYRQVAVLMKKKIDKPKCVRAFLEKHTNSMKIFQVDMEQDKRDNDSEISIR